MRLIEILAERKRLAFLQSSATTEQPRESETQEEGGDTPLSLFESPIVEEYGGLF